jgi:hypothetical protein
MSNKEVQDGNGLFTGDGDQEYIHEEGINMESSVDDQKPTQAPTSSSVKKPMSKNIKIAIGASVGVIASAIFIFVNMKSQPAPQQRPAEMAQDMSDMTAPSHAPASSRAHQVPASSGVQPVSSVTAGVVQSQALHNVAATPAINQSQDPRSLQSADQPSQPSTAGSDDQEKKIELLAARVDRIETFLQKLSQEREAATQGKKSEKPVAHPSSRAASDRVKNNSAKRMAKHPHPIDVLPDTAVVASSTKIATSISKPKLSCEYRGGINNRAWISCDGDMQSVRVGDTLPYPYGAVTAIDDKAGNITTAGGIIE